MLASVNKHFLQLGEVLGVGHTPERAQMTHRWKTPLLQQSTSHGHHRLISMLHDSVLLRRVGGGVVALDSFVGAVGRKLHGGEFMTVVGAQHLELASAPLLSYSEQQEVVPATRSCR